MNGESMLNKKAYALGAQRSAIRELFEYGRQRAAIVGEDHVFDFSLGNPSIPSPPAVNEAIEEILRACDPLSLHGYTSAAGDLQTRQAIADDLNQRFCADAKPEELFVGCGAAPELTAVMRALTETRQNELKATAAALEKSVQTRMLEGQHAVARLRERLAAVNPMAVLNRGYALVYSGEEKLLTSAAEAKGHREMTLQFADGRVAVTGKGTV